jgi:ribose transport system substrate-binding protein
VMGQNALREARAELRRPGTRLVGSVAYFPERYGDELIPLAINILQQKPAPAAIFVKHQLLTPRNVDLVYPLDEGAAGGPRKLPMLLESSGMRNYRASES